MKNRPLLKNAKTLFFLFLFYSQQFVEFQNGNASYWTVGGYFVNKGFSGYLAKLNVYRHSLLDYQQYMKYYYQQDKKILNNVISESQYQKCSLYHNMLNSVLGIKKETLKTCSWIEFFHQPKSNVCYVPEDSLYSEEFQNVKQKLISIKEQLIQSDTHDIAVVLHKLVMKNMVFSLMPL